MILRQYASNQPYLLFILPVLNVLLFVPALAGLSSIPAETVFPFDIINFEMSNYPLAHAALAWLLITGGAIWFNLVYNRHEFHTAPTFVPALVYSIISALFYFSCFSITLLLAQLFFTTGSNRLLEVFRQKRALDQYFRAGFWFGMTALFQPFLLTLLPLLLIAVTFTRAFSLREYVLAVAGFCFPFIYTWSLQYLFMDNLEFYLFQVKFSLNSITAWEVHSISELSVYGVFALSNVFVWQNLAFSGDRSSNKNRNSRWMIFFLSLATTSAVVWGFMLMDTVRIELFSLGVIFCLSYWYTNYRLSLFAPFIFYITLLVSLWQMLEVSGIVPVLSF